MLQKNLNVSDVFCGSFSLFFVLHFFAISSICMRSQHSQTQLPNHHTTIIQSHHYQTIIPKSHKNHTILETYIYIYIYIQFFCGDKILDTKKFGGGGFLEGIFHVCGTLRKRAE
jgi:hypothetical protein